MVDETRAGRKRPDTRLRDQVVAALQGYAAGQSELGHRFARRSGMPATESAAMVLILRAEDRGSPLTPARLAEQIGLTSGATSNLVNRLERSGHVSRVRGHVDRRLVTLHSTTAIHSTADAFFEPLRSDLHRVMRHYSADQLELIERFVGEMRDTVDAYAARGR